MSENVCKIDVFLDTLKLPKLLGLRENKGLKMKLIGKKSKFFRNLVHFLYACKISSPTDKRNLNENKKDIVHKILEYFVCISPKFQVLLNVKPHEKPIKKIGCIE